VTTYRIPPPDFNNLPPALHLKEWNKQERRDTLAKWGTNLSWLGTFALASPFILFVTVKPINDAVSTVQFISSLFGMATSPIGNLPDVTISLPELNPEQSQVAKNIILAGKEKGADERDISIALMVAQQEAGMMPKIPGQDCSLEAGTCNDSWYFAATGGGESDSFGVFQQRTSSGYPKECALDSKCAAGMFFDKLLAVPDRASMEKWQVAAAVQRPAKQYERHYEQWQDLADKILKAANTTGTAATLGNTQPAGKYFPLQGQSFTSATLTSGFGNRVHPITGESKFHAGDDFAADSGTPVVAPESGTVDEAVTDDTNGCGLSVGVKFADSTGVRFCHLSELKVALGQSVKAGDVIALSGNTGGSTGPHLHFERIESGQSVDPTNYLQSLSDPVVSPVVVSTAQTPNVPVGLKFQFEYAENVPEKYRAMVDTAAAKVSALVTTEKTIKIKVSGESEQGSYTWIAKAKPNKDTLDGDGLPTEGTLILNVNAPDSSVSATEHEILHILGFGTLWDRFINPQTHKYKADTLAGKSYGGEIPLDSVNGHWDEEALKNELMTPDAETTGTDMPIEAITIEALKDLGWSVR
jgi:Peptidase family M23